MKLTVSSLAVILNLLLMTYLAVAHSLPVQQEMMGANMMVIRREASPGSSSNYNGNTISEVTQLQTDLANISIPSYLKALYINLTYPNRVAHPSSNYGNAKINTIQSYKNKAEGEN